MEDATDMEHDTQEWSGGDAIDSEEEPGGGGGEKPLTQKNPGVGVTTQGDTRAALWTHTSVPKASPAST